MFLEFEVRVNEETICAFKVAVDGREALWEFCLASIGLLAVQVPLAVVEKAQDDGWGHG